MSWQPKETREDALHFMTADTPTPPPVDTSKQSAGGIESINAGGAELIAAERQRQIDGEGWTAHHDDRYDHAGRELANAAACYALWSSGVDIRGLWPDGWGFKPSNPIRNLVKAGALIAAEIDRLQRKARDG